MKKLAYLVTFGTPFFYQLCQLTIDSLIKTGFDGDVVVISEKPYEFRGAKTVLMNTKGFQHKYDPHMYRARLHELIDVAEYDVVLYLDTDVIAIKDTTPIFEETLNNDCFSVFSAPTRLHRLWHFATMEKKDRDKFLKPAPPSICSGIYAIPSHKIEEQFNIWMDVFKKRAANVDLFVCDQNVLCEAIYTKQMQSEFLPNEWLFYPKYHESEKGTELLIHHCAQSKYRKKYKYLEDRLGEVHDHQKARK